MSRTELKDLVKRSHVQLGHISGSVSSLSSGWNPLKSRAWEERAHLLPSFFFVSTLAAPSFNSLKEH